MAWFGVIIASATANQPSYLKGNIVKIAKKHLKAINSALNTYAVCRVDLKRVIEPDEEHMAYLDAESAIEAINILQSYGINASAGAQLFKERCELLMEKYRPSYERWKESRKV